MVIIALASIGLMVGAGDLQAQLIRGRVIDGELSRPIAQVVVEIVLSQKVVARAVSANDGSFQSRLSASGQYIVRASALGYLPLESRALAVGDDEIVEITLRLSGSPIPIEGITVDTRRPDDRHAATYEGLYARRESALKVGTERVVVRGDPEVEGAAKVADVLRWFRSPRSCVDLYVNGAPWGVVVDALTDLRRTGEEENRLSKPGFKWVTELPAAFVEGVEFYRDGFHAPRGYFGGLCELLGRQYSVIAIWYRRPGSDQAAPGAPWREPQEHHNFGADTPT